MKQEFTIELTADNNFSVLNRIINILNRRRVRIKKLMAHENENDFRRGGVII
jgi:acetolactate synthase small subunit